MASTLGVRLTQIGQISITVQDLDRAIGFYRDKLGMKYLFAVPKMAFFDCGGIRLMLAIPETPEFNHPSSIIYFSVPDIEVSHQGPPGGPPGESRPLDGILPGLGKQPVGPHERICPRMKAGETGTLCMDAS
jgi:catechol 2,3-dioxygenase-like lactoylglutathione lyase family enzyme